MRKAALETVYALARSDARVVFIGSDLTAGTLKEMQKEFPDRFYMEGVSEAHIIGMSAGLAMSGKVVYVNTIATFLTRRCFEQLVVDLCLHHVKVRLIANGGGLVYAPLGPTHLAIEDIALLRAIPGMTVVAPCDAQEMRRLVAQTLDWPTPIYFRVAKGGEPVVSRADLPCTIGKADRAADGRRRAAGHHRGRLASGAGGGRHARPARHRRRHPARPHRQADRSRGDPRGGLRGCAPS